MPRRKISEFRSKTITTDALGLIYAGWSVDARDVDGGNLEIIKGFDSYVVKVDQAVKGRFKKGLVALNVAEKDIKSTLVEYIEKGYESFLVEPYITHKPAAERYISLMHDRRGIYLNYSAQGGVDIETNPASIETFLIDENTDWKALAVKTMLSAQQLQALVTVFKENYFVFLEINPYVVDKKSLTILDIAVEVDDAGVYFTSEWTEADIRSPRSSLVTPEETFVRLLDANSPASFNLSVLNPNGSIFLLLSGGGASVVIADEIYNVGLGKQLANYGEYSGNPTADETYSYTDQVLKLIVASDAPNKVLFIGGAVANFTNIANTFAGIIRALDNYADELNKQGVKIYVRRGGPYQEIGLHKIHVALEKYGLLGGVYDPTTSITDALSFALKGMK
jgi:succinyl-CoA synthetase beta subunit